MSQSQPKYYSGVDSRKTPPNILDLMTKVAQKLAGQGWVLPSGGADGADSAFETGVKQAGGAAGSSGPTIARQKPRSWPLHFILDKG